MKNRKLGCRKLEERWRSTSKVLPIKLRKPIQTEKN